jgi:hypothetical protein
MSEQKEALGRPWSLLPTEATQVSPMGKGYIDTPGIHSPEQVRA